MRSSQSKIRALRSILDSTFGRMLVAASHDLHSRGTVQGASTLTMQLARNLFLSPKRTYGRKLREIMLAVQIERRYTKPQIFTLSAHT